MAYCCVCGAETPIQPCQACQVSPTRWPPESLERCRRWLYCRHGVYLGQRCGECPGGRSEGFQD